MIRAGAVTPVPDASGKTPRNRWPPRRGPAPWPARCRGPAGRPEAPHAAGGRAGSWVVRHGFVSLSSPRPVAVCRVAADVKLAADLVWLCEKRYILPPRWSSPGSAHLGGILCHQARARRCPPGPAARAGSGGSGRAGASGPAASSRNTSSSRAAGCSASPGTAAERHRLLAPPAPARGPTADVEGMRLIHDRYAARPARCCRGCEVRPCLLVRAGQPVLRTVSVTVRSLGRLDTWTHGHVADIVGAAGSKRRHLRRSAAIWCE